MTLARRYECLSCGLEVGLSAGSFESGKPHPVCGKCQGTLKRIKGPSKTEHDDHGPVRCGSTTFASDAPNKTSDQIERCPFD